MKKEGEGLIEGVWNEFVRSNRLFIIINNPEKTIPAKSSVHQVPLDNTLTATADDLLLFYSCWRFSSS